MRRYILALAVIGICLWSLPSWAETVKELKTKLKLNQSSISKKIEQLDNIKDQKQDITKEIETLDRQIDSARSSIEDLQKQISNLNSDINEKEKKIEEAEKKMKELHSLLQARIVALYKNGESTYLELLLDADSVTDFFSRYQVVESILEYDKQLLDSTAKNKELIEKTKLRLESQKIERERIKTAKGETKAQLDTYRGNRNVYLRKLNSKERDLEAAVDQLLRESDQLEERIKRIQQGNKKTYTGGKFMWPVKGSTRISSYYGYRMHPILKKKKMHTGIDISASSGTSIVAAASGTVIFADWYGGYGKAVIIDHGGGKSTLYAHCSKIMVSENQEVKAGEKIAEVGSTGLSTGPHLHFEVRENGKHVNPLSYVSN